MGFRPPPRRYKLIFDDPSLNGLEVLARSVSIGEFMEVTGLEETAALGGVTLRDDAPVGPTLLAKFTEQVVEWNLDDEDGKPAPVSVDSVRGLEVSVVRAMVKAWLEAVSGVSAPLPGGSSSGETSPEASLALENSSANLAS